MSRGRTGLIKAIKEVFREVKFFGDAEIATLRKELEAHKTKLEQLKAQRAERARREEQLALVKMRQAVEHLQEMDGVLKKHDEQLEAAAEELAQRVGTQQEREMTQAAMNLVQGVDLQSLMFDDEEQLRKQLERLHIDLAAVGRGQPAAAPAGSGAAPSGKSGKGENRKR